MTLKPTQTDVKAPDPLIDEIREIRSQIWREDGEDMERHFARLRELQAQYAERVVTPQPVASGVKADD